MDYLVRDEGNDQHAIVDAPAPIDAAQKYIDITKHESYHVNPYDLRVFPITRKNSILSPVDPLNGDREVVSYGF